MVKVGNWAHGSLMQLKLVGSSSDGSVDLDVINQSLAGASAETTLRWTRDTFGDAVVMTSSFGAESALMLHLVKQTLPNIRVVFVDTGYLFPETYRFVEELRERLDLDIRTYSSSMTTARQEALFGKLYEGDAQQQRAYLQMNKVEPLDRALRELAPKAWIAGLRRHQTEFRKHLQPVELKDGIYKVHPILDWSEEDAYAYMRRNDLPFHPLFARGYRSIGDEHSTYPVLDGEDARAGRLLGVHRECGIHLPREEEQSLRSSGL